MNTGYQDSLPLVGKRGLIITLSLAVALLMTVLSLLGLLLPDQLYPLPGLRQAYLPNDLVNILLGLPLILIALWGIRRGKLVGLLLLPGGLLYVIYNYLAYLLGLPLRWSSALIASLLVLSCAAAFVLLRAVDHQRVKAALQERIPGKFSGWILIVFGLLFIGLAVSQIMAGIQSGSIPPLGENAVAVADIVVSSAWVAGGIGLLRRNPLGYSTGLGLLAAASLLFLGLVLFFFLAPPLTGRPFDWGEVITVLVMGLIAFIPTGLYWRGAARAEAGS